jgi:hypothetical protein
MLPDYQFKISPGNKLVHIKMIEVWPADASDGGRDPVELRVKITPAEAKELASMIVMVAKQVEDGGLILEIS